jgi:hypothetical protein
VPAIIGKKFTDCTLKIHNEKEWVWSKGGKEIAVLVMNRDDYTMIVFADHSKDTHFYTEADARKWTR